MNATRRIRAAMLFPALIGLLLSLWEVYQSLAVPGPVENLGTVLLLVGVAAACLLVVFDAGRQRRLLLAEGSTGRG